MALKASLVDLTDMTLREMQRAVGSWATRNFGDHSSEGVNQTLGATEENGELLEALVSRGEWLGASILVGHLSHAILKRRQGIRGSHDEHTAAAQDAVCDIIIYLLDLCSREEWDLQSILTKVVRRVTSRDWRTNPSTGSAT